MSSDFLKDWLHRKGLSQGEKLLIVLSTFEAPTPLQMILGRAEEAGVKRRLWSNPSTSLSRMAGLAINTSNGWELTAAGRQKLVATGAISSDGATINLANDLKTLALKIESLEVQEYLREAIKSYEFGLLRSAVVMSWIAAIHVMHVHVLTNHAQDFDKEASKVLKNWRCLKNIDDFGKMKESDFLDRLAGIGVIGKTVKIALKECLDRRNACGHPNSYKLGSNTVAHHLETLILNVFTKY